MEEELDSKMFYRKNYEEVKDRDIDAENYAKELRRKYKDVIVTKEFVHGDDVLVRATTIRERYKTERILEKERERERNREHSRGGRSRSR